MYMKIRNFSGFKHLKIAMVDYLSSYYMSEVLLAAIDVDRLAGQEVAVWCFQEHQVPRRSSGIISRLIEQDWTVGARTGSKPA